LGAGGAAVAAATGGGVVAATGAGGVVATGHGAEAVVVTCTRFRGAQFIVRVVSLKDPGLFTNVIVLF
jgi:hypothetical protein